MLVDKARNPADLTRVNLAEEWEVQWWCTTVRMHRGGRSGAPWTRWSEQPLTSSASSKAAKKVVMKNTGED